MEQNSGEIILYQPNEEIKLDVRFEKETVWLNLNQMTLLFGRDKSVISRHIRNVFAENELIQQSVVAIFATTASDGKIYNVEYYYLDVIISVGYRVKSVQGTFFRQWATAKLKEILLNGFSANQRFEHLEQRMTHAEERIDFFIQTSLPPQQGILFDGQIFEAYKFINDIIRLARKRIVLIDNFVDDTVLTMLDKRNDNVSATIYTKQISKQLQLDIEKHNNQYRPITINEFKQSHDRFLLIDDSVYMVGASLKDLGKKWFAFYKMELSADGIVARIVNNQNSGAKNQDDIVSKQ